MNSEQIKQAEEEQAMDCKSLYSTYKPLLPKKKRSFWKWIISFLPIFFLVGISLCYAPTYRMDQWGRIKQVSNSPENYDIFLFVPDVTSPFYPTSKTTPRPSSTPIPTPCPK